MKTPIHPRFLLGTVPDAQELLNMASRIEQAAAERYETLVSIAEHCRDVELAALFRKLAVLERGHESGIASWAGRKGLQPPVPSSLDWNLPEGVGEEADGTGLFLMTPYRALAVAVRNEEAAFEFYTYVAAMASDDEVRNLAKVLAMEELDHVALLREYRRRAYHAGGTDRLPQLRRGAGLDELNDLARRIETRVACLALQAARSLEAAGAAEPAAVLRRVAEDAEAEAARLRDGLPPGQYVSERADTGQHDPVTALDALRRAFRIADDSLEIYLAAGETAGSEEVLAASQDLARHALLRFTTVSAQVETFTD